MRIERRDIVPQLPTRTAWEQSQLVSVSCESEIFGREPCNGTSHKRVSGGQVCRAWWPLREGRARQGSRQSIRRKEKSLRRRNDTTFHACQARGSAIVMAAPPRSRCSVAMLSTSVCPFRNSTKPRSAAAATISRCRSARNHVSSAYCMSLRRGSGLRRCDIDRCDRCPVSLLDSLFLQRAHSHFA